MIQDVLTTMGICLRRSNLCVLFDAICLVWSADMKQHKHSAQWNRHLKGTTLSRREEDTPSGGSLGSRRPRRVWLGSERTSPRFVPDVKRQWLRQQWWPWHHLNDDVHLNERLVVLSRCSIEGKTLSKHGKGWKTSLFLTIQRLRGFCAMENVPVALFAFYLRLRMWSVMDSNFNCQSRYSVCSEM